MSTKSTTATIEDNKPSRRKFFIGASAAVGAVAVASQTTIGKAVIQEIGSNLQLQLLKTVSRLAVNFLSVQAQLLALWQWHHKPLLVKRSSKRLAAASKVKTMVTSYPNMFASITKPLCFNQSFFKNIKIFLRDNI